MDRLIEITEQIKHARESQAQLDAVNKRIKEKEEALRALQQKERELHEQYLKEERDVEKLSTLSFANFTSTLFNTKYEKLEKEELEAYQAKKTWDAIKFELAVYQEDIQALINKIDKLKESASSYRTLIDQKMDLLKERSHVNYTQIAMLEQDAAQKKAIITEYAEAIMATSQVQRQASLVLEVLSKAKDWSTYDMIGGGMIATMMKRERMDDAKHKIDQLNYLIGTMTKELKDIGLHTVSGIDFKSLSVADYFFDGIFVDLSVHHQIKDAMEKMDRLQNSTNQALAQLKSQHEVLLGAFNACEKKMLQLIEQV
ncbi:MULTISPECIES: hypothetical protein [unclassified Fusibacter]|uniref:hypothetical protein n=1 Tax=unclassified Fusibacter TaxID=2624464 RepID=UPI001013214F|nr:MULTISPECIES: hypothetical protein [unclassified Fusibacter]MCK8058383.1 hypothetical protein [Fusibacter sp. A2]NPE20966.1 hypothetical protein [Fusibacter sp. A1]RXV63168.1 hypothetical protein DWB64_03950 [Fusibacter sp. A1]